MRYVSDVYLRWMNTFSQFPHYTNAVGYIGFAVPLAQAVCRQRGLFLIMRHRRYPKQVSFPFAKIETRPFDILLKKWVDLYA